MSTPRQPNGERDRERPDLSTVRGRRRFIIEMCQRRQRPGSGSAPDFLAMRSATMSWPNLDAALGGIPWAVVGAVASRLYMPERATADLDVVVRAEDGAAVRSRLGAAGYRHLHELAIGGSSWTAPTGQRVDVLEASEPWWADALQEAAGNRDPQGLRIVPLSYLVLSKLTSGRALDVADVTRMLGLADDAALDQVRALIARESPEDLEDLESLIALGQLETKPPPQQ